MTPYPPNKQPEKHQERLGEKLREKHPQFRYESFSFQREGQHLVCRFLFFLEPDITFSPEVSFECRSEIDEKQLRSLVFHLGMVESIIYWKAACSPVIQVNAGILEPEQLTWWHDLFIHGLGEFYCRNQIDFTPSDFLSIRCNP